MLSLYRAWLGPPPSAARPAPPPGALRPEPRRARAPSPPRAPSPARSASSSELDVERVEPEPERAGRRAVLDVASCDGPVRFSRVPNAAWREGGRPAAVQYYPCKTCGCRFPSYYFVHKHRKRCHADEAPTPPRGSPEPSTSAARA